MLKWIIKIFALLSVVALIVAMAAEFTTAIGDFKSMNVTPTLKNKPTLGISLARMPTIAKRETSSKTGGGGARSKASKQKGTPIVCQAYELNTDFPQRPGAIFPAIAYHLLTLTMLLLMVAQQTLRGLMPLTLGTLYRFVPALSGKLGLSGSGLAMIYIGSQIMSYNIGRIHLIASILLFLAGIINLVSGFVTPIASCEGMDPYADWGGAAGGAMPYDDGFPPPGPGGPMDPMGAMGDPDAPDPYDGQGPDGNVLEYDGADGVGARAPPPGAIPSQQTFGAPPAGVAPLNGYAAGNAETNPQLVAQGVTGSSGDVKSEVVFDPSTGLWSTIQRIVPKSGTTDEKQSTAPAQPTLPIPAFTAPSFPQMPIGYDAFGRPIMPPLPSMVPGWPNPMLAQPMIAQPAPAVTADASSTERPQDPKKVARKEARRQYERMRDAEERTELNRERQAHDEERERWERRERRKAKERERQLRRREKEEERQAREIAEEEAKERRIREAAEEDARRRRSKQLLIEKRQQAIDDARRQAMEREQRFREEQERAHAEQMRLQREEEQARRQALQAQALAAVQEAAEIGLPLDRAGGIADQYQGDRDSYLTRAETEFVSEGYLQENVDHVAAPVPTVPSEFQFQQPSHLPQESPEYGRGPTPHLPQLSNPGTEVNQDSSVSYRAPPYEEDGVTVVQTPSAPSSETASARERLHMEMEAERQRVLERQHSQTRVPPTPHEQVTEYLHRQSLHRKRAPPFPPPPQAHYPEQGQRSTQEGEYPAELGWSTNLPDRLQVAQSYEQPEPILPPYITATPSHQQQPAPREDKVVSMH